MSRSSAAAVDFDNDLEGREYAFSDDDFRVLAQAAKKHAGITLSDAKRSLIYSRLSRRLRALGMTSFAEYRALLERPEGEGEIEKFINSVTTNYTKFFREGHHFEHLTSEVVGRFSREHGAKGGGRLRIWSAGCSTGEEPYTIALVLKREIAGLARQDVKLLATDIDTDVLGKASRGRYPAAALDEIPDKYQSGLVVDRDADQASQVGFTPEVRSLISFGHLNLMEPWPFSGLFDAIFCRNVIIYFDAPTKLKLIERFVRQLKPQGHLYIGHSESLVGASLGLRLVGRTTYRKES